MRNIPYAVNDKDGKFLGFINGSDKKDAQKRLNAIRKGCKVIAPLLMHGNCANTKETSTERVNKKRIDSACWRGLCQK